MVKKGRSAPETEEMTTRLKVRKARNFRRKGWEMRRIKLADSGDSNENGRDDVEMKKEKSCVDVINDETQVEIWLSFPASCSSSENDAVVAEKSDAGDETCEKIDETLTTSHGFVSIIGGRREMEDAVTVRTRFMEESDVKNGECYDFFGVYDGHGGSDVAQFCHEKLHQVVANEVREDVFGGGGGGGEQCEVVNWEKVMAGSFRKMDQQVGNAEAQELMKTIGSTAVVAVVGKEQLIIANCGDSRAVICRCGVAVPLSIDHKPDRTDELERVEAAGGIVINWNGFRVLGILATSRSIGDQYLKPFVTSEPEVTVSQRTKNDEFLILASDGLWDVISNQVACQVVRKFLYGRHRRELQDETGKENNATRAAVQLAELAMACGSKDNITVVVVDLRNR